MKPLTPKQIQRLSKMYDAVPGLAKEITGKLTKAASPEHLPRRAGLLAARAEIVGEAAEVPEMDAVDERIIATTAGVRPVARIRDNQVTTEFIGPDSESWAKAIAKFKDKIDAAVPAVGRIELNNSDYPWAGTGWLVAEGIIVTNRHVATLFAERQRGTNRFVFKPGLVSGDVTSDIDFLEEENRRDSVEHPITSILWIADQTQADVAFLQVTRAAGGPPLPKPIALAESDATAGVVIGAIGYPARDPSIRDQRLVVAVFGDDVYDKKRFSPGKVMSVDGSVLKHDCSTLGGNSGSVLLNLETGEAVGIHRAGLLDDSANLAVTAAHIRTLLDVALRQEAPAIDVRPVGPLPAPVQVFPGQLVPEPGAPGSYRAIAYFPIEFTVKVGAPIQWPPGTPQAPAPHTPPAPVFGGGLHGLEYALAEARRLFGQNPNVLQVRAGYRFKNGWITDERVVVIEVREKRSSADLLAAGESPFPFQLAGIGLDVRTAPLPDQLEELGVDPIVLERPGRPAGYTEPRGYDDPNSPMYLGRVNETMSAIFHVSPDAGFANLKAFIGRVEQKLTATIYEWDHTGISDALEAAMQGAGKTLRMVTQKNGVGGSDATESAVNDMKDRLGSKFKHVYASVRGPQRLIPDSYHIKVASRDGEEMWLSSGNWKTSNQPETDAASRANALRKFNREWHAIVKNKRLATLFQKYIEFDFREATRVPLEEHEAPALPDIEFFIPEEAVAVNLERVPNVTYKDELTITEEVLDVQPLLTPDRDADGNRLFMKTAIEMLQRATRKIYIQNQSFNLTEENNAEFDQFFEVVKEKQRSISDVRIIFRDARDYGRTADLERQQELLERLKDFGIDVKPDAVRLQGKCHNKGIIIDSSEVLLGSQNLTNGGSLFNRDASLLVRSGKVAKFYEKIFLYDWENLAHNEADERVGGIRRANPGDPTPVGFRRVRLSDLIRAR